MGYEHITVALNHTWRRWNERRTNVCLYGVYTDTERGP